MFFIRKKDLFVCQFCNKTLTSRKTAQEHIQLHLDKEK
jgi:Zinc-finger of C2H2 type